MKINKITIVILGLWKRTCSQFMKRVKIMITKMFINKGLLCSNKNKNKHKRVINNHWKQTPYQETLTIIIITSRDKRNNEH